jgi:hypothetical protein
MLILGWQGRWVVRMGIMAMMEATLFGDLASRFADGGERRARRVCLHGALLQGFACVLQSLALVFGGAADVDETLADGDEPRTQRQQPQIDERPCRSGRYWT